MYQNVSKCTKMCQNGFFSTFKFLLIHTRRAGRVSRTFFSSGVRQRVFFRLRLLDDFAASVPRPPTPARPLFNTFWYFLILFETF